MRDKVLGRVYHGEYCSSASTSVSSTLRPNDVEKGLTLFHIVLQLEGF